MKKVISIFCFIFLLINIPRCFAFFTDEVIIANPGYDYSELISKEGHYPIGNNINWFNEGVYNLNYYNEIDDQMSRKNIIIASNESLKTPQFYNHNCFNVRQGENYYIVKSEILDENKTIVIGYVLVDDNVQYQDEKTHPFVQYYYHNQLVWEKVFTGLVGKWVDMAMTPYGILVLGESICEDDAYNIVLAEISYEGHILRNYELNGTGEDRAHKMILIDEFIYIVGQTSSTDLDYEMNSNSNHNVLIVTMRYDDFTKFNIETLGNNGYNFPIDALVFNGDLYVLIKLGGNKGWFKSQKETYSNYAILRLNKYLDLLNYYIFDDGGIYEGIVSRDNDVIVISNIIENNSSKVNFYKFDHFLTLEERSEFIYPVKDLFMYDLDINFNQEIIWIMSELYSFNNSQLLGYSIMGFSKDFNNVYINKLCQEKEITSFLILEEIIYIYGSHNGEFFWDWCFFINLDAQINKFKVNNYELNTIALEELNDIDYHIFGRYEEHLYHSLNNFSVYNVQTLVIEPCINIRSNEKYDIGVALEFNGIGYLNDFKIDSGHIVTEEGKYLLEVVGHDERKLINFYVQSLSTDPLTKLEEELLPLGPLSYDSGNNIEHSVTFYELSPTPDKPNNIVFVVLSVILCSALGGWIIPGKKRGSKIAK